MRRHNAASVIKKTDLINLILSFLHLFKTNEISSSLPITEAKQAHVKRERIREGQEVILTIIYFNTDFHVT